MSDIQEPSKPSSKKHKVIHWNPELEDSSANAKPAVKAYMGGAIAMLLILAIGTISYFLFIYQPPEAAPANAEGVAETVEDPRRAFESISRAQAVQDTVERKLEAARQMPIAGNEVLRQKLIAIEKEKIDADDLMGRSRFARAIAEYNAVDTLIEDFTGEVENKQRAQRLYDSFIVRSSELEKGKHLNEESFEAAFGAASQGKNFLDTGSFSLAAQRLEESSDLLDEVDGSIRNYVRQNAAQGNRFIAQGKSQDAVAAYTRVLEIEPENEEALRQLERARVADRAFRALQLAAQNEQANDLEVAFTQFQEALSIDPASAKAQSGISRLRRKIEERDFSTAIATAELAISDSRYEDAIDAYREALTVFPDRLDIEEAIRRAVADKRQNDIVTRITLAYNHERDYQWEEARDLYLELLKLEPELSEAKDGLLRTGRVIRSILRYETLIEVAKTEARRSDFQLAIRTFDEAMQAKPEYLALSNDSERLRSFLQLQSQPVVVTLVSDDSTSVTVQGPTRLTPKKFDSLELSLLPGKYFIIGRKKGFRDVRVPLQVRAGMSIDPISVIAKQRNN